jgi:hypothetical protein
MRSKEEKASFIRSLSEAVEIMEERGTIVPTTLLEDYSVRNGASYPMAEAYSY